MTASLISPQVGAGAIRLRNEEEQMNKRPETQANRKNTSPSSKRVCHWFLASSIIVLVAAVLFAHMSGALGTWTAPALHTLFGARETSQKVVEHSPGQDRPATRGETPIAQTSGSSNPLSLGAMSLVRITPMITPALPGEGGWIAEERAPPPYTSLPLMARTFLRPDPLRPAAIVTLAQFDTRFIRLHMVAGTTQPGGPRGVYGPGVIPASDQQSNALLAAFNGGFMYADGQYGMQVNRTLYVPPQPGNATVAVTKTGQIIIGAWGVDQRLTSTNSALVAWRQNAFLLIDHGVINPLTQNGALWGLTVLNQPWAYTWRSGLGITAQGTLLYAEGNLLSAQTLARALSAAGAVMAMQTDINHYWVRCFLYHREQNGALHIIKLDPTMYGTGSEYVHSTFRDFFYMTRLSFVSPPPPFIHATNVQ